MESHLTFIEKQLVMTTKLLYKILIRGGFPRHLITTLQRNEKDKNIMKQQLPWKRITYLQQRLHK